MKNKKELLISFLLRSGLAIVFIYAAISSFLSPERWMGFIPNFITFIISPKIFLIIFSIYQIGLGISLLLNYKTFQMAFLSSITLLLILFLNIFALDLLFRDIAILFMSLTLMALSYKTKK